VKKNIGFDLLMDEFSDEEVQSAYKVKKNIGFDLLMDEFSDEESEDDNYEDDVEEENVDENGGDPQEEELKKEEVPEIIEEDLENEQAKEAELQAAKEVLKEEEEMEEILTFEIGEEVWRKDQVCVVTKIDHEVDPPAYTVKLKGTNRLINTEGSRLRKYVKKKRKKKRRKKKKKNNQNESEIVLDQKVDDTASTDNDVSHLLSCDTKLMDADQEMIRRFGKPMASDNDRKARRERHKRPYQLHRKTAICRPKPEWPPLRQGGKGGGLYMSMLEKNQSGVNSFRLHFNDEYARQQEEFQARASTMDPHIVAQLLQVNHFHVDTLLTMSEMLMRGNQTAEATDFVERALFRVECAFHGKFDISTGRCRLPFAIKENQMVFVALKKHIYNVGRRGCWRSAFECCKLLLALDPSLDPMFALLMLDYWALQARQYAYLVEFASKFQFQNCSMMLYPNFCYSVALAKKFRDKKAVLCSSEPLNAEIADVESISPSICLQQAILLFPEMVGPLLKKCKPEWLEQPDWVEVFHHTYFIEARLRRQDNSTLRKLVDVYIERTHLIWTDYSLLQWLLMNCQKVIERLEDPDDQTTEIFPAIRDSVYDDALPSRFRMLDVDEFSDTIQLLPPDDRPQIAMMGNPFQGPNMFENQHPATAFLTSLLPWMHTNDVAVLRRPPNNDDHRNVD